MNNSKVKSVFQNIVLVLFSLTISIFLTFFIYSLFDNFTNSSLNINPADYLNRVWLYSLITLFLPLLSVISLIVLIFSVVFKITQKFPKIIISAVILIIFGGAFVFRPYKIAGGSVGKYKSGQIVLTSSRSFFHQSPKVGRVVIFNRPDGFVTGIGLVVAIPGDSFQEAYIQPGKKLEGDIVPEGTYLVRFGDGKFLWAVQEQQITQVVWYPI